MAGRRTVRLNIKATERLLTGAERLTELLGFVIDKEGFTVKAEESDRSGVVRKGRSATIYYHREHMFYRGLGILLECIRKGEDIERFDDGHFETLGVMIDASRCAVPTVKTVMAQLDYLAVMGYNMAMLYTEDTVKLDNRPYFGYMRGRYTREEIKAIDDYAYGYGIEIIPCLECYGHMAKYLIWDEAAPIKDTAAVLLAREEKTFEFLDELISTVSSCVRSRRIHVGMDEAWDMGRGKFLDKHGYVPPFQIFNEYMDRLIAITDKYGLKPMMWSDMYFRVNSKTHAYCDEEIEIPKETADKIPEGMELVFWHYGEKIGCDDYMLKKHKALNRNVLFAGGLWSWDGHFPENEFAMDCSRLSINACRANGVREAMMTVWLNDNAECELNSCLFGLSFFAELCYNNDVTDGELRSRFEAVTQGSYDAFRTMGLYHNYFEGETFSNRMNRFVGKCVFWQDIMEGLYDYTLFHRPMSEHYYLQASRMKSFMQKEGKAGKWYYLYDYANTVFEFLAIKCEIAEKLVPSYKTGDRATLAAIVEVFLPKLKKKTIALHKKHKAIWFNTNKIIGWSNMDIRYAGIVARCDTAIELIDRYLKGEDDCIEELEEERLYKPLSGFIPYSSVATPNIKT